MRAPADEQSVLPALTVVIGICFLGLRTWTVGNAWFYSDDFIFLTEATDRGLTLDYLFTPHDSHLMPWGVLLTWLVGQAGAFAWGTAAALTILMSLAAAAVCWWMLWRLYGPTPWLLVPWTFYLFTPMAIESTVWWAAALNAVPLHIAFFGTVAYLDGWMTARARGLRAGPWLAGLVAAMLFGVFADPRGIAMLVPLAVYALVALVPRATYASVRSVVRMLWQPVLAAIVVASLFLTVFALTTPSPVSTDEATHRPAQLAWNLVVEAWLPSLLGGPLSWSVDNDPMSVPTAPSWLLVLSAVVLSAGLVLAWRRHSARYVLLAGGVVALQLGITYLGLLLGRGVQLGPYAGLMTRFLVDTVPITTLSLALLVLGRPHGEGAPAASTRQRSRVPVITAGVAGVIFVATSTASTITYASAWHGDFPARAWIQNARTTIAATPGPVADVEVPDEVQSRLAYPHNLPSRLLRPLGDEVRAVMSGNNLRAFDDEGFSRRATVRVADRAAPGPDEGCGYRVTADEPVRIAMDPDSTPFFWWVALGYLGSESDQMSVSVNDEEPRTYSVQSGLNTLYLSGEDPVDSLTLQTLSPTTTLCVDTVVLGDITGLA